MLLDPRQLLATHPSLDHVLLLIDDEGRIVSAQTAGVVLPGLDDDALEGQSAFVALRAAPQLIVELRRALAGELHCARFAVGDTTVEATFAPLCDRTGHVGRVLVLVTPVPAARAGRVPRVLVVDDDLATRTLLTGFLSQIVIAGAQPMVQVATNGLEAIQRLATFAPDLIILDHYMPVMDGVTFLRVIRQDHRYTKLPVIVITGKSPSSAEIARLEQESLFVLRKEMGYEARLEASVRQALAEWHPSAPA